MPILGSHNSMTYLQPDNYLYKLFSFCWKCQSSNIEYQLNHNIRCFDLRIVLNDNKWSFAHGKALLKGDTLDNILNICNKYSVENNIKIYIRLILEESKENKAQEDQFIKLVYNLYNKYTPNLIFFEFTRKYDWKQLVDLGYTIQEPVQYVGSMQSWYGKIWPWLYWKLNHKKNQENIASLQDTDIVLTDFV